MCKISFVILHYENLTDTKSCLNSLEKYACFKDVNIVVVDNGSKVGKVVKLEEEFKNKENFFFIHSSRNLGFAKGNNIGFKFAKFKLKSDVIILANNDLIFSQEDFLINLQYHYRTGFDIAGPKIISLKSKENQNPVHRIYRTKIDVKKRILKFKILYFLSFINLDLFLKRLFRNKQTFPNIKTKDDFQLHGACLIFSGKFILNHNGLYDKTFMYGEESILKYFAERENMSMAYFDDMFVEHKEGATTEQVFSQKNKKRKFFYYWNIDSCKLLLNLMKNNI